MMLELKKLLSTPLPSTRSGAFYNAFPYPTKISPEAIAVYIACLTQPGEIVLDAFGGSGSTGTAALLCEHPTEKMKALAKTLDVAPVWGKRGAVLYEIGAYGAFAAETITNRLKAEAFQRAVDDFVSRAEAQLSSLYAANDCDGQAGFIRHVIWSERFICPACRKELSYFEAGTSRNPVRFAKKITCPFCKTEQAADAFPPAVERVYDALLKREIVRKKREPAWIYGTTGAVHWDRAPNAGDLRRIQAIEREAFDEDDAPREIQWGDLHRTGYHFGITHLHHFYTRRNYTVMYRLWKLTESYPDKVKNALRLLLLSYNATHCTMMTRVVAKKHAKDFILTGAQSGVLYVSRLPVEKNILFGLKRKAAPFYEAYRMLENCSGEITIHNSSSEKMLEDEDSVHFAFTDPPFGGFIPYAEVNQINELWLKRVTDRREEIIISPSQKKGISDYQRKLTAVFREINRVLKPDRYAAVVFHAAKAKVWEAFEAAIEDSGLAVHMTGILDKKQASFKQVVSSSAVQGDPLILLKAARQVKQEAIQDRQILAELVREAIGREAVDERRIFSLYVTKCLERGQVVRLDAKDAYAYIRCYLELFGKVLG